MEPTNENEYNQSEVSGAAAQANNNANQQNDPVRNVGFFFPQYFITEYKGCRVLVDFDKKQKWEDFKKEIDADKLHQLSLWEQLIDVWVTQSDLRPITDSQTLQKWFDDYCLPFSIGFNSFSIPPTTADMLMAVVKQMNECYQSLLKHTEDKLKKLFAECPGLSEPKPKK